MTYVKFDQGHTDDPRWIRAGADALALHVAALVYCDRLLTDGRIEMAMAMRVSLAVPPERVEAAIAALVKHGFWTRHGHVCQIVNYTSHAFPAEQVERTRARWNEDKQRHRQHKVGDHSLCNDPKYCPVLRAASKVDSTLDIGDSVLRPGAEDTDSSKVESTLESKVDSSAYTKPNSTRPDQTRPEGSGYGYGDGSAHAEPPVSDRELEPSPGQEVPNEPVPEDEVADPYLLVGHCLEHNCKGGLDRRIADGQVRCPTHRKEAKAKAKLELDQLRAAAQVESGRAARAASDHRLNGQDETARAEAAAVQLRSVEQDDEEITARHAAAMNGQAPP